MWRFAAPPLGDAAAQRLLAYRIAHGPLYKETTYGEKINPSPARSLA